MQPAVKPLPFTVSVNAGSPAVALVGASEAIVGNNRNTTSPVTQVAELFGHGHILLKVGLTRPVNGGVPFR